MKYIASLLFASLWKDAMSIQLEGAYTPNL